MPRPPPSAFRVSHPLDGLLLPEPSGPISCRKRSWGFPFRAFPPHRAFVSSSDSVAFVAFASARPETRSLQTEPLPSRIRAFKALLPVRIRHLQGWGEPLSKAAALLVFTREGYPPCGPVICVTGPPESCTTIQPRDKVTKLGRWTSSGLFPHRGWPVPCGTQPPFWVLCTFSQTVSWAARRAWLMD